MKYNSLDYTHRLDLDHNVISAVFNILYENKNPAATINAALEYLGNVFNSSRCFIVESFDKGISYNFTHSWRKQGFESHVPLNKVFSHQSLRSMFDASDNNGVYACNDINDCKVSRELKEIIMSSSTKSFLHAQTTNEGYVDFCIGIEDCVNPREWTCKEINTFSYLSKVFSIIMQVDHLKEEYKLLSSHSIMSAFVGDNTDNFIYIVDVDTYDILYMNKKALHMYGNPPEEVWKKRKCYELLHEKVAPCEFCTNKYTTEHSFYEWEYFNPRFNKTYLFKDKLVPINGKLVKLQVATDVTRLDRLERDLQSKLEEHTLLLDCIKMLHTSDTPDESIEKILYLICGFFGATRGVIIQIAQDGLRASNTHEWTDGNTAPKKAFLQDMDINVLKPFFDKMDEIGVFASNNVLETFKGNQAQLDLMKHQEVTSFICAPILSEAGKAIGMIAVDNQSRNIQKSWLLGSLSSFVSDFLGKNRLVDTLNELSYFDPMTGVRNRHSYRRALKDLEDNNPVSLGVAYVDIRGLARINEEKGTLYGDEIIKRLANVLSAVFGEDIFRVGGDEFVVLLRDLSEQVFEGKISVFKDRVSAEEDMSVSIGFTWNSDFSDDHYDGDEYTTVRDNKSYTAMLSKNLDREIKSGKYAVVLQPQMSFKTGELDGIEALIRRIDASGNMQSPAAFVPFYEKEGMISKIDFFVFESMCKVIAKWNAAGVSGDLKVSVNFSRATVMERDLVIKLSAMCDKHGVAKSRFVVEITETISHSDDKVFSYIISSLRGAGFCVSLDDFGSGESNLYSLKISDFEEIKIDMGLTRDIHIDKKAKILTKVALNMCDEFKYMVSVAEGIETVEQYDILKELNCHKGQGYYFSKPIDISSFEQKYFERII